MFNAPSKIAPDLSHLVMQVESSGSAESPRAYSVSLEQGHRGSVFCEQQHFLLIGFFLHRPMDY